MQVAFFNDKFTNNKYSVPKRTVSSPIIPALKCDTVTFGALKKSQFNGLDFFIVERFKAPIEKFNKINDLHEWAGKELERILQRDLTGRKQETKQHREIILDEWKELFQGEKPVFSKLQVLLIFDAITKNLKRTNDALPPKFNENIISDCIAELYKILNTDRKYQFNLNKIYQTKLESVFLKSEIENLNSFWMVIPSKINDPENYAANLEKLKILSSSHWCTKGASGANCLSNGDMHIYFEKGHPRIGLRFVGEQLDEIQSEHNNRHFSLADTDCIDRYIKEHGFKFTMCARIDYEGMMRVKRRFEKSKRVLAPKIAKNDVEGILEHIGIKVRKDEDGLLILDGYRQPDKKYTFTDLGIDENKLFERIKEIKGNAVFVNSNITSLGNLKFVRRVFLGENTKLTVEDFKNINFESIIRSKDENKWN